MKNDSEKNHKLHGMAILNQRIPDVPLLKASGTIKKLSFKE